MGENLGPVGPAHISLRFLLFLHGLGHVFTWFLQVWEMFLHGLGHFLTCFPQVFMVFIWSSGCFTGFKCEKLGLMSSKEAREKGERRPGRPGKGKMHRGAHGGPLGHLRFPGHVLPDDFSLASLELRQTSFPRALLEASAKAKSTEINGLPIAFCPWISRA